MSSSSSSSSSWSWFFDVYDVVATKLIDLCTTIMLYCTTNWKMLVTTFLVLLITTSLYWTYSPRRQQSTTTASLFTTPTLLTDQISIGSSYQRRRQTLSMFSCSLSFIMPAVLICNIGSIFAIFWCFTYGEYYGTGLLLGIYVLYSWFLDMAPTLGDRTPWMRGTRSNSKATAGEQRPTSSFLSKWWEYGCDYLPLLLVKTADLPAFDSKTGQRQKYVLGYHPHGIIAVGAFCAFATDGARVLDISKLQSSPSSSTNNNNNKKQMPTDRTSNISNDSEEAEKEWQETVTKALQDNKQNVNQQLQNIIHEMELNDANNDNEQSTSPPPTTPPPNTTLRHDSRGFSSLFPGLDRRVVTLPQNFYTPFLREYFLSMGAVTSDKLTFRQYLSSQHPGALVVVVGGAAESLVADTGSINLILERRRGFVREAIIAGASLVPVLGFGETDLYQLYEADPTMIKIQKFVKGTLGFGMPIFRGRSMFLKEIGVMPKRTPVVVVVGKPIPPPTKLPDNKPYGDFNPKIDRTNDTPLNDDGKILIEWHKKYVQSLDELYQTHKDSTWNMPGQTRSKSLRIVR